MHVLYITGEFPPMRGSIGDHTARLATAVMAQGHQVGILTSTQARDAALPGAEVFPIVQQWNAAAWRTIADVARRYDVLHLEYQAGVFGMGVAPQLMADALRLFTGGKPIVTTFHDLLAPYLFPKAGRVRGWSVRHLARASEGVVATNEEDAQTLRQQGIPRVWQIPIASPLPLDPGPDFNREVWRESWGISPQHKLLVHFGFINRAKGVETLLRAYDGLLRAGQPVRLLMAGDPLGASDPSNEAYLAEIKALAEALNLREPFLQWTGDLSEQELIRSILAADLIVLPFREGASLRRSTLIMSLTLGKPVVTTEPITAIPILQGGHNVAFVRRDDHAALARQIALLIRYQPTMQRLERGASQLQHHFDWSRIAEQYIAIYNAVRARR